MSLAEAIKLKIYEIVEKTPDWFPICFSFYKNASNYLIDEGHPSQISYKDLFLQEYASGDTLTSGYIIGQFHALIVSQKAAFIAIAVPDEPLANSQREHNNYILKGIAQPFQAEFDGTSWGEDGTIEWDAQDPLAPNHPELALNRDVWRFPLEVGTCSPITLWVRFMDWGGWARWPYHSQYIYLFAAPKQLMIMKNSLHKFEW
ncbi:hypothetical protein [Nostoc sp. CALU 1950]|uniref:hypothetical protein n=1 Tax=Nostoc sp. CALU 1950 TaxID=3104321 RepID=UPI003EBC7CB9